jgi:NAD-dependent SIR2 family protein deacetylase
MAIISPNQHSVFEKEIENLAIKIIKSKHLVLFTGAGISTDSGISDYRGEDGVWTRRKKGLSEKKSKAFSKFKPSAGHKSIYKLYKMGYLKFLITQNLDNLHRKSGIPDSILAEIHGNYSRLRCNSCDKRYSLQDLKINDNLQTLTDPMAGTSNVKECTCGGKIIPTFVNFGSPLLEKELQEANAQSSKSDVFIAIGTTLSVEPASLLPKKALNNNAYVVIINNARTSFDLKANLLIQGQIEIILPKIVSHISKLKKKYQ